MITHPKVRRSLNPVRTVLGCLTLLIAIGTAEGTHAVTLFSTSSRQDPFGIAGTSARAEAMGTAFVGLADDSACLLYNPAGLGALKEPDMAIHHQSGLVGISQELITAVLPLKGRYGIGLAAHYVGYGEFEGRGSTGNILPGANAYQMGLDVAGGFLVVKGLSFGVLLRGTQQVLAERAYTFFTADAGLLYALRPGWRFGVSCGNLGLTSVSAGNARAYRAGFSRSFSGKGPLALVVSSGVSNEPHSRNRILFGMEGVFRSSYFLRAGYRWSQKETGLEGMKGFTVGAGLAIRMLRLDYVFEPFGDLGNTQRVSLSVLFGAARGTGHPSGAILAGNETTPLPTGRVPTVAVNARADQASFVPGSAGTRSSSTTVAGTGVLPLSAAPVPGSSQPGMSGMTPGSVRSPAGMGLGKGGAEGISPASMETPTSPRADAPVVTAEGLSPPASVKPEAVGSEERSPGDSLTVVFDLPSEDVVSGQQFEKEGRWIDAFQAYRRAIQRNRQNAQAWWRMANIYYRYRQKEQAIRCYEEVLRLKPEEKDLADWLEKYRKTPISTP